MTAARDRFDSWLERELRRDLAPVSQRPAPRHPRYASRPARGRGLVTLFSGAGAAVASKAALGFAVTAFAVGITGAAVETAVTGSPLPVGVEQQVASAVQAMTEPAPPAAPTQVPTAADQSGGIKVIASASAEKGGGKPAPAGDHRKVSVALPSSEGEGHPGAATPEPHPTPRRSPSAEPEPTPRHTPSPPSGHKPSPRPAHPVERGGHGEGGWGTRTVP